MKQTLGEGSFGCVKLVVHKELNEERAMKVLKKKNIQIENDFINEISMLKSIDHPNVVRIFECFQDEFNFHIVTEFCREGDLIQYIIKEQGICEETAAYIMKQVLSAVSYCHEKNIVHRDLKAENILITSQHSDGKVDIKVIDFGISCKIDPKKTLTKASGSPLYMAPEVFKKKYNEKCDIWSCGVLLYLILSGTPPFIANSLEKLVQIIMKGQYSFAKPEWDHVSIVAKDLI